MGFKLIDLSQEIYPGAPVFPGHPQTVIEWVDTHESTRASGRFENNYGYQAEKITISTHGTTHVDSISHIDPTPGAPTIDVIPLERFFTGAVCIDMSAIRPRTVFTVENVKSALAQYDLTLQPGDTLLIYTGNYTRNYPSPEYLTDYPGFSYESACWVYDQGVVNIGTDAPSHDAAGTKSFPAHVACREKQTMNIENLGDLRPVIGKRFQFICFPLKIRGGSGSPIRAVAVFQDTK